MKRILVKLLLGVMSIFLLIGMLNISVTTKQGINYRVRTLKIPLYLKILDFLDRYYNYRLIVERITTNSAGEKDSILRIFNWTYENIKPAPQGYPVIDDHVWHIIVRGYGVNDQSSDVFTTLCNYAGADAFFNWVGGGDNEQRIPLSFVKINGRWSVFDPYSGVYFTNHAGQVADIEEILRGDWQVESIGGSNGPDVNYAVYLKNLQHIKGIGAARANMQSPFNRLKYEIKKCLRRR